MSVYFPNCPNCNSNWKIIGNFWKWDIFGCAGDCGLMYKEEISEWVYKFVGDKVIHWQKNGRCFVNSEDSIHPVTYISYVSFDISEQELKIIMTFS